MTEQYWKDFEEILNNDIDWNAYDNANILITGSTGMLGKYIVQYFNFLKSNRRIKINITELKRGQVLSPAILNRCTHFFHCASPAQSNDYTNNPVDTFECNVIGTWNVLNYLRVNRGSLKAFVFFSSGEALDPCSCYGEAKRATEKLCEYFNSQYNLPTYIVRLDHTFAPTVNLEKDKRVFADFIRCILNNEPLRVKSPKSLRTFTYITDAINGVFRVIEKGHQGHAYNISNPRNLIEIENLARRLTNNYIIENSSSITTREPLNIYDIMQLGYDPKVDVVEGFWRVLKCLKS